MGTDTTIRTVELARTAARLADGALSRPLSPLDAGLLSTLITTSTTARDYVLATLTGHHPADDPAWLTDGPHDPHHLTQALAVLGALPRSPETAAMRAWVLWALHRPVQALNILHSTDLTRFGILVERAIAICPPPSWTPEPSCSVHD